MNFLPVVPPLGKRKKNLTYFRIFAALFLTLLATLDSDAQGTLVWSTDNLAERGWTAGESWEIALDYSSARFWSTPPSANAATRLFWMTLATNDTGRTFFANALNEPGFPGFVSGLTDGTNGYIRFQDGESPVWMIQAEQDFLLRSSLAPDLAGYNITQINFRVNDFYDWYYPAEQRNFRTLKYSLDFYGEPVPEPGTWALLGAGAAAVVLLRRARQQQRRF